MNEDTKLEIQGHLDNIHSAMASMKDLINQINFENNAIEKLLSPKEEETF